MNPSETNVDPSLSFGSGPRKRASVGIARLFKLLTIEPVVFLYGLGISISFVVSPALYMEKICTVGSVWFGNGSSYDKETCKIFDDGNHTELQDYVQKTYASIQLVTMFVKGIPPIIFALFIGPWSDKFGRKFLIVFPLIGYAFYNIWFFINVIFYDYFVVEFLMLEVIQFWFGGFMCLFLGLYSYVSDISEHKTRTVRIAFVDFVLFVALSIGSGVSGEIASHFGYEVIYAIGGTFQLLAILYAIFFVKESKEIRAYRNMESSDSNTNSSSTDKSSTTIDSAEKSITPEPEKKSFGFGNIFNLNHIKESFGVAFKRRPGGIRHVVIIMISLFGLYSFANNGASSINIQYARKKFQFGDSDMFNKEWARIQSIGTVFNLFAIGALMPIMTQILRMRDLSITAFCVTSSITGITTILLATDYHFLYLANFFKMFSDVVTVGIRSALTKIVGERDVGKVFACVGAIQALVGLVSPVYQLIYRATYDWHLGFVYCISCTILSLMLALTIYVFFFLKRYEKKLKAARILSEDKADTSEKTEKPTVLFKPSFKKIDPVDVY